MRLDVIAIVAIVEAMVLVGKLWGETRSQLQQRLKDQNGIGAKTRDNQAELHRQELMGFYLALTNASEHGRPEVMRALFYAATRK